MTDTPAAERRRHPRYALSTGLSFHHGPSRRDFPARSRDVSRGGVCLLVPPTVPVQPGHNIRLALGQLPTADCPAPSAPVTGTVVRVDRRDLTREGYVSVGVRFDTV